MLKFLRTQSKNVLANFSFSNEKVSVHFVQAIEVFNGLKKKVHYLKEHFDYLKDQRADQVAQQQKLWGVSKEFSKKNDWQGAERLLARKVHFDIQLENTDPIFFELEKQIDSLENEMALLEHKMEEYELFASVAPKESKDDFSSALQAQVQKAIIALKVDHGYLLEETVADLEEESSTFKKRVKHELRELQEMSFTEQ